MSRHSRVGGNPAILFNMPLGFVFASEELFYEWIPACAGMTNCNGEDGIMTVKVLFVCMGNICRSPTAEAVFRHNVEQAGLDDHIHIDSAGTHDYHIGDSPDMRSQHAAKRRGYNMSDLRGRQVEVSDLQRFDYVLAMDNANLDILKRMRTSAAQNHLGLFLEFSVRPAQPEVPDPYYGGVQGFEHVLDLVEDASQGLLQHIRQRHFKN